MDYQKQCNESFDLQTGGGTGWCGLGMLSNNPKSIKPIKTTVIKKLQ